MEEISNATVESTPAAGARAKWVAKLRYTKSFLAKLCLSDKSLKETYCALFNALLAYEGVSAKSSFSCVTFSAKRKPIAIITLAGKTLNVHLAIEPSRHVTGRYRLTDVSVKKRFSRVPAKYRVKSPGGLRFALLVIKETAEGLSLTKRSTPILAVTPKDFPTDSFSSLIARGLIRTMGGNDRRSARVTKEIPLFIEKEAPKEFSEGDVYSDTVSTDNALAERHEEYGELLSAFTGEGDLRLVRRKVVRSVDESWVCAVEDCMTALDEVTRNPSHFIEETEELLPIERTKKVTTRSIKHLSQHTGLISRIEGNMVIPSKLLNVFRDESVMTYENKFVNTLLLRLYDFVNIRYEEAAEFGANRIESAFTYTDTVRQGEEIGKLSVTLEVSAPSEEKEKNTFFQSDLWARVKKLKEAITDYRASDFATMMGNAVVRPPIVRTNPILKNKDLRQCLELWEFLEGYDDEVSGVSVSETDLEVSDAQKKFVLQNAAQQYLMFRRFSGLADILPKGEPTVVKTVAADALPEGTVVAVAAPVALTPDEADDETVFWVEVALQAEEIALTEWQEEQARLLEERERLLREMEQEKEEREKAERERSQSAVDDVPVEYPEYEAPTFEEEPQRKEEEESSPDEDMPVVEGGETVVYVKSFSAKLRIAPDEVKEYYCAIANALLAKKGVRERHAFDHSDFYRGRTTIARVMMSGKTLRVYFMPLSEELRQKYGVTDKADVKKFIATPCLLKVRGPRGLKKALDLIAELSLGAEIASPVRKSETDFTPMSLEESLLVGEVRRRVLTELQRMRLLRMRMRTETPREEYDYSEEVAAYTREHEAVQEEAKELVIPSMATATEIGKAFERAENEEILSDLGDSTPTVTGGDGDPLFVRAEAIQTEALSLEEPKKAESTDPVEHTKRVEVPPDGDVLTPKPITADDLSGKNKSTVVLSSAPIGSETAQSDEGKIVPEEKPKKKGFFSRIFGRKDIR